MAAEKQEGLLYSIDKACLRKKGNMAFKSVESQNKGGDRWI